MIVLRLTRGTRPFVPAQTIAQIATRFPGHEPLQILVGERSLKMGAAWRYDASPACLAALGEYGEVEVAE